MVDYQTIFSKFLCKIKKKQIDKIKTQTIKILIINQMTIASSTIHAITFLGLQKKHFNGALKYYSWYQRVRI
ncbi:MAG: hypothetical protein RSD11_05850, partial [Bacteroides sp.]|uniref:hypothetical protein n=1 Tax=Bacteroides sp. TaxID=29523 RepID=UPI002FC6B3D4